MNDDRDWVETGLLGMIAYGTWETMDAQQKQLQMMQRLNDMNIMADKYPGASRVELEQWVDRYYLWKYGPQPHFFQTVGFRLFAPIGFTIFGMIIMIFAAMQDTKYFLSNAQINSFVYWTIFIAVASFVICNVIGWRKEREYRRNWPARPPHTPEIY